MEHFTPITGLIGGMFIGLSAASFVLLNGRVAGISGIVGGVFSDQLSQLSWRLAFIVGIVIGPFLVQAATGTSPVIAMQVDTPLLVLGGLLVGFGSRLGSGCTSGHGICGLARGSERSLVATATFFSIALATVFLMRHVMGS